MKSLTTVLVGAVIIISLGGCGVAANQTPSSPSSPPKPSETTTVTPSPSIGIAQELPEISVKTADQTSMQAIDFLNSRKGFLAGHGGIWETIDGGQKWSSLSHYSANFHGIQFVNGQAGWIWGYRTLMSTENGGNTWHVCYHGSSPFISVSFTGRQTGYAIMGTPSAPLGSGGPGYGLYQTGDGGRHWQALAIPFHPLAVAFRGKQLGWAVGTSHVWRTTDGGKHWFSVYRYGESLPMSAQITVATPKSIWVTLDGGSGMSQTSYTVIHGGSVAGWRVVAAKSTAGAGPAPDASPSAPNAPELAPGPFTAVNATTAFLGGVSSAENFGSTAIWATYNGGQSWISYPAIYGANGIPGPSALSFATSQKGWLVDGLNSTQVFSTDNGGKSWHQVFPSPPSPVRAISFVTNDWGYGLGLPGQPNQILMTRNRGKSWHTITQLPLSPAWEFDDSGNAMDFTTAGTGWVVRQNHLFQTINGAKTWTSVSLPHWTAQDTLTRVTFVGQDGVVGSPYSNTCWWTVNGGHTWNYDQHETFNQALTDINRVINQEVHRVGQPLNMAGSRGPILWVVFQNQSWAISSNGGLSWTMHIFSNSLAYSANSLTFTNAEDGWLQTGPGRLYRTQNGGTTWQPIS